MTRTLLSTCLWLSLAGCTALYPEIATPLKPVPPGRELDPPPPPNVLHFALASVQIPPRTRDGRPWDAEGEGLPDPFAIVLVNGKQLFTTAVERDSLKPTWPKGPRTAYEFPKGARVRVEIWDDNPISKRPICAKEITDLEDHALTGSVDLVCDNGTEIQIVVKAAEAKFGLGFSYEFRSEGVFISDVMPLSPASRAKLYKGDQVTMLMGQSTKGQTEGAIKSLINANAATGLKLEVSGSTGTRKLELKEGPVYVKGN